MPMTRRLFDRTLLAFWLLGIAEAAAQSPPGSAPAASQRAFPGASPQPSGRRHPLLDGRRERIQERVELMREHTRTLRDRRARVQSAEREMREALRHDKLDPEEIKQKLGAFESLRAERRREHRARLHSRWGDAVTRPEVKSELEQHGRRTARLSRLEVVAATERDGKVRKTLIERIQKLREVEVQRHQKLMQGLVPNAPAEALEPARSGAHAPRRVDEMPAAKAAPSGSGTSR